MSETKFTDIADFDLYTVRPLPELQQLYREFQTKCPVGRSEQNGGFWFVTSYDDVHSISRDADTFSNKQGIVVPPIGGEPLVPIDFDPPEHGKYRSILQPWLSAASVRRYESRVEDMAHRYLSKLDSPCDMVTDFALPYALEVVTTVLGVPPEMRVAMVTFMRTLLGEAGEDRSKAAAAMDQFGDFVQQALIDPRRAKGPTADPDDVVDLLVGSRIDGRELTDHEIRQTVAALLNAGFETTYKSLASCLWYLAENQEAWKALKTGAVSFETAFEELLRYTAPVSVGRTATRDVTVGGEVIKAGDWVLMCLPAVNRDENEFADPECLMLSRHPNRHLTFGTGIHRCIGMHVARLELSIALKQVLHDFEWISVPEGQTPVFDGSQAAGIVSLPTAFARSDIQSRHV